MFSLMNPNRKWSMALGLFQDAVIIFDRGYYSKDMFRYFSSKGYLCVMRIRERLKISKKCTGDCILTLPGNKKKGTEVRVLTDRRFNPADAIPEKRKQTPATGSTLIIANSFYKYLLKGCGHFLGLPKRRSQVMPDTLQDSYILMTLLFCLRYTRGDSYPTPA